MVPLEKDGIVSTVTDHENVPVMRSQANNEIKSHWDNEVAAFWLGCQIQESYSNGWIEI